MNKIIVTIVIALNALLIISMAYFLYDTHKRAQRIDAMIRTHLEQRLNQR